MKTPIKILLILLAVGCVVTGVLFFVGRSLTPPAAPSDSATFTDNLEAQYSAMTATKHGASLDNAFDQYADLVRRFAKEQQVSDSESASFLMKGYKFYGPIYSAEVLNYFDRSRWDDGLLEQMRRRVVLLDNDLSRLLNTGLASNDQATEQTQQRFKRFIKVTDDYRSAKQVAGSAYFGSTSSARERLHKARTYLNDSYLRKNTALSDRLRELPRKIEAQHYSHIAGLVKKAAATNSYDDISAAQQAINEYNSHAAEMYGSYRRSLSELQKTLSNTNIKNSR